MAYYDDSNDTLYPKFDAQLAIVSIIQSATLSCYINSGRYKMNELTNIRNPCLIQGFGYISIIILRWTSFSLRQIHPDKWAYGKESIHNDGTWWGFINVNWLMTETKVSDTFINSITDVFVRHDVCIKCMPYVPWTVPNALCWKIFIKTLFCGITRFFAFVSSCYPLPYFIISEFQTLWLSRASLQAKAKRNNMTGNF